MTIVHDNNSKSRRSNGFVLWILQNSNIYAKFIGSIKWIIELTNCQHSWTHWLTPSAPFDQQMSLIEIFINWYFFYYLSYRNDLYFDPHMQARTFKKFWGGGSFFFLKKPEIQYLIPTFFVIEVEVRAERAKKISRLNNTVC